MQSVACAFWVMHFLMLHALLIALLCGLTAFRNIVSAKINSKYLRPFIFLLFSTSTAIILFNASEAHDLLAIIALSCGCILCLNRDNPIIFFCTGLTGAITWLFIHLFTGSIPGLINETLMLCSILYALSRALKEHYKQKNLIASSPTAA